LTSDNTIFTHRAYALGPAEGRSEREEGFQYSGKQNQPDTSARLISLREPEERMALQSCSVLKSFEVVNTRTLSERAANCIKTIFRIENPKS
jgi:hypothetical protein